MEIDKGKWLVIEHKTQKLIKINSALPKGSLWQVPMVDGMIVTSPSYYDDYKIRKTQMHRMHE